MLIRSASRCEPPGGWPLPPGARKMAPARRSWLELPGREL